jgi:O-acetyl-ADP-ribose deacetylase (regulator of RNase III)
VAGSRASRAAMLRERTVLRYVTPSLFESPAQTLVNTVNTVGIMGKGIAAEFKRRYPDMYEEYRQFCRRGELAVGKLYLYRSPNKWVLNFPTKQDWRRPSKLEWIEAGLKKFVTTYTDQGVTSASFPMLGCGNGQLDWALVQPVMESYLKPLTIPVFVHLSRVKGLPEHLVPEAISVDLAERETISFFDFWNDLRHAVGVNLVTSLGDDDAPDAVLQIPVDDGQTVTIPRASFEDLFHMLRLKRALRPSDFPVGLHEHGEHVVQLLLQLGYVEAIEFSAPMPVRGIRYAPRATSASGVVSDAQPE